VDERFRDGKGMKTPQALIASPAFRFDGKLITRVLPPRSEPVLFATSFHLMELEISLYRIRQHTAVLSNDPKFAAPETLTTYFELLADTHSYTAAWVNRLYPK
jgi:hypothetical protein